MSSISRLDGYTDHPYFGLIRRMVNERWWIQVRNTPRALMRTYLRGDRMPYGYKAVKFPEFTEEELVLWNLYDFLLDLRPERKLHNHLHWLMNTMVIQAIGRDVDWGDTLITKRPTPEEYTYEKMSPGFQSLDLQFKLRKFDLYNLLMGN